MLEKKIRWVREGEGRGGREGEKRRYRMKKHKADEVAKKKLGWERKGEGEGESEKTVG